MSAPVRRNDPCPCGSGLRFKECHGKLDSSPTAPVDALVRHALQLHQKGDLDGAERLYHQVLGQSPGNAIATHYLGMIEWHRGGLARAEEMMRAAIAADPGIADFHNNLGLLLRDTGRRDEALACFRETLRVDPGWLEAFNNIGLTLEASGRSDDAIAAYREAIAREPRFPAARQNLARALVAAGQYAEGWQEYRWRLVAQGVSLVAPDAAQQPFPAVLKGRRLVLRGEQGIGDVLFFLRFAPELVRRGAELAFRGDARLAPLLQRTGLFALGVGGESAPPIGPEAHFVGDLPWLLQATKPAEFPPPLRLVPDASRVAELRQSLQAVGPKPWIAVTWRAGIAAPGVVRTQLKEMSPALLGNALRGLGGTCISVQRQPRDDEREALGQALGRPVHDASAANDDLESILALMAVVDEYVGVSNANAHLRGGAGGSMQVLVPFPPEWRWGLEGDRSPWFPTMRVLRQAPNGRWDAALAALSCSPA